MSGDLLRAESAAKLYPVSRGYWATSARYQRAFGPVDLAICPSERVALAGRSGAGKSTLARCLAGLEPLTGGRLVWGGARPSAQLLFQDSPAAMNPRWTIGDILEEPLRIRGQRPRPAQLAARLEEVGLGGDLLARLPWQLSGGQCRRVLLARALAVPDVQLLLLDEPLAGLDAGSAREIAALLANLQQRRGFAMLLISHDLASLASFAGRVLVMSEGRIVEERQAGTFLKTATHPESLALLAAMLPEAAP